MEVTLMNKWKSGNKQSKEETKQGNGNSTKAIYTYKRNRIGN